MQNQSKTLELKLYKSFVFEGVFVHKVAYVPSLEGVVVKGDAFDNPA